MVEQAVHLWGNSKITLEYLELVEYRTNGFKPSFFHVWIDTIGKIARITTLEKVYGDGLNE